MKSILIIIKKVKDNHFQHYKQQVKNELSELGEEFHIWEVDTKHRMDELKREFKKDNGPH